MYCSMTGVPGCGALISSYQRSKLGSFCFTSHHMQARKWQNTTTKHIILARAMMLGSMCLTTAKIFKSNSFKTFIMRSNRKMRSNRGSLINERLLLSPELELAFGSVEITAFGSQKTWPVNPTCIQATGMESIASGMNWFLMYRLTQIIRCRSILPDCVL